MARIVGECGNSPRHITKTHGSHNGRWHSWPHIQDRLDRPRKLKLKTVTTVRKHRKLTHPRKGSKLGKYTGGGRWSSDIMPLCVYIVAADQAHDGSTIEVKVHARGEDEAVEIGRELLLLDTRSALVNERASVVVGGEIPPEAAPLPPNPWIANR